MLQPPTKIRTNGPSSPNLSVLARSQRSATGPQLLPSLLGATATGCFRPTARCSERWWRRDARGGHGHRHGCDRTFSFTGSESGEIG
jgi:hypothetical protein